MVAAWPELGHQQIETSTLGMTTGATNKYNPRRDVLNVVAFRTLAADLLRTAKIPGALLAGPRPSRPTRKYMAGILGSSPATDPEWPRPQFRRGKKFLSVFLSLYLSCFGFCSSFLQLMRIERSRRRVVIGGGPPSVRQMEILRSGQGRRVGVRSAEGGGGGGRQGRGGRRKTTPH